MVLELFSTTVSFGEEKSPHWCEAPIGPSQFEHLITDPSEVEGGTFTLLPWISASSGILQGVNTRGAGEGNPFTQGEHGGGVFSGQGWLLSISLSGDSTSLSPIPIPMSDLILWAKGERFEGESRVADRFLTFWVLTETACRRWTQACAACLREPFLGGGSKGAAKAALWSTERR